MNVSVAVTVGDGVSVADREGVADGVSVADEVPEAESVAVTVWGLSGGGLGLEVGGAGAVQGQCGWGVTEPLQRFRPERRSAVPRSGPWPPHHTSQTSFLSPTGRKLPNPKKRRGTARVGGTSPKCVPRRSLAFQFGSAAHE